MRLLEGEDLNLVRTFSLPERSSETGKSYICACAYDQETDLLMFSSVDHQVFIYEAEGRQALLHSFEDPFKMFYSIWYLPINKYWVLAHETALDNTGTVAAHFLTVFSIKKKIGVTIRVDPHSNIGSGQFRGSQRDHHRLHGDLTRTNDCNLLT